MPRAHQSGRRDANGHRRVSKEVGREGNPRHLAEQSKLPFLRTAGVRPRHIKCSQGQILALASGRKIFNPSKVHLFARKHFALRRHRGASLIRNTPLLGPFSRTLPSVLRWSLGGGLFLRSEVPLYLTQTCPTPETGKWPGLSSR